MTPHYAVQTPAGSLIAASLHEEKARQILWSMRSADRVVRDDGVVVARKGAL